VEAGVTNEEVAHMGDDLPDIPLARQTLAPERLEDLPKPEPKVS
jgi:hypothetical protein